MSLETETDWQWRERVTRLYARCWRCIHHVEDHPFRCRMADVSCVNGMSNAFTPIDEEEL